MKNYKLKFLFVLFLIYYRIDKNNKSIYLFFRDKIVNNKIKRQIININKYYDLCNKGHLINKNNFENYKHPKISIISAVYNSEQYIIRFLRSIQNQFFHNIEIIFVDDYSKDNTTKVIEECQKEDKRITLIKQKKNKGTLISRNIGVLKAKGEFLIFPDPDDILSNDILKICYNIAKRYNYDLIRFIFCRKDNLYINKFINMKSNSIYQPELSSFIFYSNGYLELKDFNICNKFIKRVLFLRTLNNMNNFYLNQYMIYFEDGFINYALHRNAKSLYLLNNVGYYYISNNNSVTNNVNKNLEIKCFIFYLNFVFENSKNNQHEKNMANNLLQLYINNQKSSTKYLNIIRNLIKILESNSLFKRMKDSVLSIIPDIKTIK